MKNFQSLFLYLLAATCVWVLTSLRGCDRADQAANSTSHIAILDTVHIPELYPYPIERIRRVVVHDSVFIERPTVYVPSSDGIILLESDPGDSLVLYSGEAKGEHCQYRYLAGVHADTLAFLNIESACEQPAPPAITITSGAPTIGFKQRPGVAVGLKAGWLAGTGLSHVGVQAAWRRLYGSANLLPSDNRWLFEVGVMVPLSGRKSHHDAWLLNSDRANSE